MSWLDSRHTFSFGEYYDPAHLGFHSLRVINDDRVAAGGGFATHGHRDMEILTYVLEGALEHKDSLGTGSIIRPGEAQRMSAGTGINHSEFNQSTTSPVHFLQIWIIPAQRGIAPGYQQCAIATTDVAGPLRRVAGPGAGTDFVTLHQDVDVFAITLGAGESTRYTPRSDRYQWIQCARGAALVNQQALVEGDGLAIEAESAIGISTATTAELLLFDLA